MVEKSAQEFESLTLCQRIDMRNFYLDLEYFKSITIHKEYHRAKDPQNPTQEELIAILKHGPISMTSTSSDDHPEFKKLRYYLGENKFIYIERGWWNGDRVLKPFKLNGLLFKKGDKFCSAGAMHYDMEKRMAKRAGPVTDSKSEGS